jgi:hypothetical protein
VVLFVWFVSHQGRELAEASRRIEQPQLEAHCEGVANGSVDVIHRAVPAPGNIYVITPLRFKLGGHPVLNARFNVETAGSERKRPEI